MKKTIPGWDVIIIGRKKYKFMLTPESWCIPVVGGGVLVSRIQPIALENYSSTLMIF